MSQTQREQRSGTSVPRGRTRQTQTILGVRTCDSGIQGPENLIIALTERLTELGVRYVVANLWDGQPPRVALHEELQRRGKESHVLATSWGMSPAIIWKLSSLVRRVQPDVVHTHDVKAEFAGLVAARTNRKPLIGSYYGRLVLSSWFLKVSDYSRFGVFRLFDRVLANSEAQRAELKRFRIPADRIDVLPSCVDTRQLRSPTRADVVSARQRLGLTEPCLVLATVARLSRNKGHTFMLQALPEIRSQFPDVVYLVPGEGDVSWHGEGGLRNELEAEAARLGVADCVRFLGYYPDVQTVLHAADLVVSPSLLEGMQVALLEAMAAGRPIVATAIGGTPDAVVDGETGLLVPPKDSAAITKAVCALLRDPEQMRRMGAAGRQRAEQRFDAQVVAQQLLRAAEAAKQRQHVPSSLRRQIEQD